MDVNKDRSPTLEATTDMTRSRPHLRYKVVCVAAGDFCSVIDIFTGLPLNWHGWMLNDLNAAEAYHFVDMLNAEDLVRRGCIQPD